MNFKQFSKRIDHHYSDRLALRPIALSDAWPLFEATQADGFNEHLLWQRPEHHLPVFERIESIIAQAQSGQIAAVAAVARKTGQFAALYRFAPFADGVEMSLWTHPAFWGGGFGTETTRLAVHAAMAESNTNRLYARSMNENKPAQRVLEKVGLKATDMGSICDESGAERHYLTFTMDRADWNAADASLDLRKVETPAEASTAYLVEASANSSPEATAWVNSDGCEFHVHAGWHADPAPAAASLKAITQ
ncbi:MAG: GNAT family N-acetyltransferase [Burkholderiaceae bacterium]